LWRDLQEDLAALAARTAVVLAHHPVYNRVGEVVTTSVTNLDIHDIARSATTYGVGGYFPVSPVAHQRDKIERIVAVWRDEIDQPGADNRGEALGRVEVAESIEAAIAAVEERFGVPPIRVATSARAPEGRAVLTPRELVLSMSEHDRPLCLLFGTGWGLCDEVLSDCDAVLEPISGFSDFNHLSVRSAVAVTLDRLFGRQKGEFLPNP